MRDEQSPWSDHIIEDDDGAASIDAETTQTPLFENSFLQRWLERKDPPEGPINSEETQRSDTKTGLGDMFHNLFPSVVETKPADRVQIDDNVFDRDSLTGIKRDLEAHGTGTELKVDHQQSDWEPATTLYRKTEKTRHIEKESHKKDVVVNATNKSGEMYFSHPKSANSKDKEAHAGNTLNYKKTETNTEAVDSEYEKPSILERQFDNESGLNNIGEQYADEEVREVDFDIKHEAMDDAGITDKGYIKGSREFLPPTDSGDAGPVPISILLEQKKQGNGVRTTKSQTSSSQKMAQITIYAVSVRLGAKVAVIVSIIWLFVYLIR